MKNCVILAAGLGTRMRPLTDHKPKPLIEVNGKPLIAHIIDDALAANCEQIIVNVHYLADMAENYLRSRYGEKVFISDERETLLDSGGGVTAATRFFENEKFFCINADCIWTNNIFTQMREQAAQFPQAEIIKALRPVETSIGYFGKNIYNLMSDGKIIETQPAKYCYTGAQILSRSLFKEYQSGDIFSLRDIWRPAFERETIYGFSVSGEWLHVGDPQGLETANAHLSEKEKLSQKHA